MGNQEWEEKVTAFKTHLLEEERTALTIRKYLHDIDCFFGWLETQGWDGRELTKEMIIAYKGYLMKTYKITSANSMITALNRFFRFCRLHDLCIKNYKVQRQYFRKESEELTKEEYRKLAEKAEELGKTRLLLLIQTLACTGIRIRELGGLTVESVREGKIEIYNKGKWREVYLPRKLRQELMKYCKEQGITTGPVILTYNERVPDRVNVWNMLKRLAKAAGVPTSKVYPHNFRHLFAFSYYEVDKDLAHLADLLGHSNVETTRRYTIRTLSSEEETIEKMGMI